MSTPDSTLGFFFLCDNSKSENRGLTLQKGLYFSSGKPEAQQLFILQKELILLFHRVCRVVTSFLRGFYQRKGPVKVQQVSIVFSSAAIF